MTEWQMGIRAFQEGRLREAADRLKAASVEHERTVSQSVGFQTYTYLGAALYALGQASAAADAFAQAVSLRLETKPPLDLMINLANARLAAGHLDSAEQALTETLQDHPGAMEARTLLERLRSRTQDQPLTGAIFGETPESVKRFLETLTFSSVPNGYAPAQVRAAMAQIGHYIDLLSRLLDEQEQTVSLYVAENERLRQSEETLVENLVQARQEADQYRRSEATAQMQSVSGGNGHPSDTGGDMTPLEKLFQKKTP
jgi:tetratricopeptide (TPR) repeat protein